MEIKIGSLGGLVCDNFDAFKQLEKVKNLKSLYVTQWGLKIGDKSAVVDLRNTQIVGAVIRGINANIYLPNTCIEVIMHDGGIPIIAENSDHLTSLVVGSVSYVFDRNAEFFNSLQNATSLDKLILMRLHFMGFTSLSNFLTVSLPSVTQLSLNGSTPTSRQNVIKDLKGLNLFPNLKYLNVYYTDGKLDISEIKNCSNLIQANFSYANVQSLSGIEGLDKLQKLIINGNNISSLKPLEGLKNLEYLELSNNAISDTSNYIESDGSTRTYNNLEILANLNKNGKLKRLYLSGNDNIINWSPLSSLTWTEKSGW